jgi:hypothetical protein
MTVKAQKHDLGEKNSDCHEAVVEKKLYRHQLIHLKT